MRPTGALAREMIAAGVEAHIVAVDLKKLPDAFAGRRFDGTLLADCRPASILAARTANFTPSCGGADAVARGRGFGRGDGRA